MKRENWEYLKHNAEKVAPRLLGCILERELGGDIVRVKIVETEAYHQDDAASHSYKGRTPRTDIMFGPPGHLYVYFTYGMHYCANIVTGEEGIGQGVLIRAVEPIDGEAVMQERRPVDGRELTNGPAKLCQALGITKHMNGHDLHESPLKMLLQPRLSEDEIVVSKRIGISKAKDKLWRFHIKDNSYVSHA